MSMCVFMYMSMSVFAREGNEQNHRLSLTAKFQFSIWVQE